MEYLEVGRIVRTVGLKGEVKVYPSTHFRDSRFKKGNHLFVLDDHNNVLQELTIKSHRSNGDCDNVTFNEISSIEEAEKLGKVFLNVIKDRSFLKNGQYFYSDLIGMKAFFDNNKEIGVVKSIEEFSSYVTLRIKTSGKDVLVPFVDAFIKSINLDENKIIVKYIEGLV